MIRLSELERDRDRPVAERRDDVDWEREDRGNALPPSSDSMWSFPAMYGTPNVISFEQAVENANMRTYGTTATAQVMENANMRAWHGVNEVPALRGVDIESATDVITAATPHTHAQTGQYCSEVHTTMGGLNRLPPCIMCKCGVFIRDQDWGDHVGGEATITS